MINVSSLKSSVQYWLLLVPQVFRVNNGSFWNIEGIFQLTPVLEWRRVDQTSRQKGKWMVHLIRNGYDCLVLHHLLIPTPTPPSWHWLQERKTHFIIHLKKRGSSKWKISAREELLYLEADHSLFHKERHVEHILHLSQQSSIGRKMAILFGFGWLVKNPYRVTKWVRINNKVEVAHGFLTPLEMYIQISKVLSFID